MLKVTNLYKSFGERTVLSNISFELNKGEILCLRGKSGAGKTTIFNLLCKMYDVRTGEILIEDNIYTVNGKKLSQNERINLELKNIETNKP